MQSTLKLYMRILFIGDLVGTHVVVQYSCRWQGLSNATTCAFESRISSAYTIHFLIESTTTTANRRVRPQMKIFCNWKAWEHSFHFKRMLLCIYFNIILHWTAGEKKGRIVFVLGQRRWHQLLRMAKCSPHHVATRMESLWTTILHFHRNDTMNQLHHLILWGQGGERRY